MTGIAGAATLFAIAPEYAALIEAMLDADGDMQADAELTARLNEVALAFDVKVEKLQFVFRHLSGDAASCRAFAQQLAQPYADRATKLDRAAERVKKLVFDALMTAGVDRVETELGGARIQGNGGVQPVLFDGDPAQLPEAFRITLYTIDREAVLKAAKAGQPLPEGVTVAPRGRGLRWL